MSYGIVAMYKQNWDNFGGFSKDFFNKKTWGGENWNIIDGVVKGGLKIERKRFAITITLKRECGIKQLQPVKNWTEIHK